jgi:hypothetical protein
MNLIQGRWTFSALFCCAGALLAQAPPLGVPAITATVKGPNQINLTWRAVSNPGYGYLVEIQSAGDSRYASWQELRPIPSAAGYQCDNTVRIRNGACNISDPAGAHVYNPPSNGVPYWVTEPTYIDPQDGSAAQFIAGGLKPDTTYLFRVRAYSGIRSPAHGGYSNTATATTARYGLRYVSPGGNDASNGADESHAWRTLAHASRSITCGQVLMVKGGSYPNDMITMVQTCTAASKAVVLVNPGETAAITSAPPGGEHTAVLLGSYLVIDGLTSASSSAQNGDYDIMLEGGHNAVLNVETHPAVVPASKGGVQVHGDHNLVYHSYLHDAGSPDATQNPGGNGGFVLTLEGARANGNVIWSNHLTRGGHDVSLCIRGCSNNRWLNNVMDGGWGMGWEAIQESKHNLVEGNIIKDVGQLVAFYKPAIEVSEADNTVRRNVMVNAKSWALEVSALHGGSSVANTRVYNNTIYKPGSCFFASHNGGVEAYDHGIFSNNICYAFTSHATDIFLANKNSQISYNDILALDADGHPQPEKRIIIWNHEAEGEFQYPRTLVQADSLYSPPFSHNKGLDVVPEFVDEARLDFHLAGGSPLAGAGTRIQDPEWGFPAGKVDLGAFGVGAFGTNQAPHPTVPARHADADEPAAPAGAPAANRGEAAVQPQANRLNFGPPQRFGPPQLDRPTLTAIGVKVPIVGEVGERAAVTVRYREAGGDGWRPALPLLRVHPEVIVGLEVEPHFGGTIFDLKPGARYEIALHAVDPDGKVDRELTLEAATRAVPRDPVAPHEKPVSNAQELTAALHAARPGDIIRLADGVYSGQFRITAAGTPDNPVVIRGASQEKTILDGQGCTGCNVLEVYGGGFVHIERMTVRNAERAIRFQTDGAEGNVVRRVHVRDTTMAIGGHPGQKDFYICDNTVEGRLRWPQLYNVDNGAHSDDDGIQVVGFGHVVCHNRISGYGDAMKIAEIGARGVDFYGNDILYSYDNGIELDEGAGNVRCFRNRFYNAYSPLSVQPIFGGPAYLIRNVVVNALDEQMKFHGLGTTPPQEPSGILAFHNTFVSAKLALNLQTPAMSHYFVIANNLFIGPKGPGLKKVVNWEGPFQTGVFDYNGYFPDGIFDFNRFHAKVKQFPAMVVMQGYGLETHGLALTAPIFQNGFLLDENSLGFVQPVDLTLAANSGALDRGVYLPNINDGFTGAAPDLGALERGCPAPLYGPRPEGMDESNMEAGCPTAPESAGTPTGTDDALSSQPALLLYARMTAGVNSTANSAANLTARPPSPRDIAEEALMVAATGNLDAAFGYFNAANFPQPKQEDAVREAYFELQLQRLLKLAAARACPAADQAITNLGYEDKSVPFSFFGFGSFQKRPRVQFLVGSVEFSCVDEKSARKRWEKVSKAGADLSSVDYAFPYLALAGLNPEAAKEKVAAALEAVNRGLAAAGSGRRGVLFYHQGLLRLATGEKADAAASFSEGAKVSTGLVRYLNLDMLRGLAKPQF